MEDFNNFVDEPPPQQQITKKRKRLDDDNREDVKKKAMYMCQSKEQWSKICNNSTKKLIEFIETQEWENSIVLKKSIFDVLLQLLGIIIDKATRSNGYVQTEIDQDDDLRQCIEIEGSIVSRFINNKARIGMLLMKDVINGKKNQSIYDDTIKTNVIKDNNHPTDIVSDQDSE